MKKSICLMLSVILAVSLLLVFSGCDFIKKRPDDTKEPAETLPSGQETSDTGEESGGDSSDVPETIPSETEEQLMNYYSEEEFYENKGEIDIIKDLSYVAGEMSPASDGKVLVFYPDNDEYSMLHLRYIDFENHGIAESNLRVMNNDMEYVTAYSYILNGYPSVCSCEEHRLYIMDENLKTLNVYDNEDLIYGILPVGHSSFIMMQNNGKSVTVYEVHDGGDVSSRELDVTLPEGYSSFYVNNNIKDQMVLVWAEKDDTPGMMAVPAIIDLESEKIWMFENHLYADSAIDAIGGGLLFTDYSVGGDFRYYDFDRPNALTSFTGILGDINPSNGWMTAYAKGIEDYVVFTRSGNSYEICIVDPKTSKCEAKIELEPEDGSYFAMGFTEADRNTVCTQLFYGGKYHIAVIHTDKTSLGDTPIDEIIGRGEKYENDIRAEQIWQNYGISVYLREDAVRYINGYALLPENDEARISAVLDELEDFFASCPEGFIAEVASQFSSIDVCITSRIIPDSTNRNSIGDAAAFVSESDGIESLVISTRYDNIRRTVAHEFMHIIQNNLLARYYADENAELEGFDRWPALNPPDFDYTWVYTYEDGVTIDGREYSQYLASSNPDDLENIFFIDGYSTSYPNEDIARIFEYIATYDKDSLPTFFGSIHLQLKAGYISACLRYSFSTLRDLDSIFWEEALIVPTNIEFYWNRYPDNNYNLYGD